MIKVQCFKNKRVALFGLGGSGIATALALMEGGADVIAFDDNQGSIDAALAQNITVRDLRLEDWSSFAALILSPGVPLTHPKPHWVVELAKSADIEIIGDIELFVRARDSYLKDNQLAGHDVPFIAITGTNGKSTTTALIAHLLLKQGFDVQMGGNIGTAILSLEPFEKNRIYVIECSSFQIDLTPSINPTIGILLNLTPDHIDRHANFENYAQIKERLVKGADCALISIDDHACQDIYNRLQRAHHKVLAVSKDHVVQTGLYADGTKLYTTKTTPATLLADLNNVASLRGRHNAQNALMAVGALQALNITDPQIQNHLASYDGLPHRMQLVRKIGNALFVNDSKATNAEASAPALASFNKIYWIIGGLAKEGGIEALKAFFPKIQKAYLIGEAADNFAKTINGAFPVSKSGTLDKAVQEAAQDAAKDDAMETAVLLSPACASYDQFKNYSARGDVFIKLVKEL